MAINPGDQVRIKSAPDKIGVAIRAIERNGVTRWEVRFPEGPVQRLPQGNLEIVSDDDSIEKFIADGQFGGIQTLRLAITHARLTGRLADIVYSMESTNTEFFPYQFKPVLNFLDSPVDGILIADEVGLGKTIEAGLIWTELKARFDANRLLIVCPAVLRDKWQSELENRFGIQAMIGKADDLLKLLQSPQRMRTGFCFIASYDGLRPPRGWDDDDDTAKRRGHARELAAYIRDKSVEDELFDCVIMDEAHYLRNRETQTHSLAQLLRPAATSVVLLSATPIQLKSEDLFNLLNVIDPENFHSERIFDNVLRANEPLIDFSRQLRARTLDQSTFIEKVQTCRANRLLETSQMLKQLEESPPSDEDLQNVENSVRLANRIERINLLGGVINRTRKRDVHTNVVVREPSALRVELTETERTFYELVTDRVRDYCSQFDLFEGFMLTIPQRQLTSSIPAAVRAWRKKLPQSTIDEIAESIGTDASLDEHLATESEQGPLVSLLSSLSVTDADYQQLRQEDSKFNTLSSALKTYWHSNPGGKVVLFSYYRETLFYLEERFLEQGIKTSLLMGGMGKEKKKILDDFESTNGPDLLLTSEVLSEGVDLQFSSMLVNFDLPWNPMRVEQRIGRIDRIGQKQPKILIWNLFYEDTIDDRIYNRLFTRLETFTRALGDMEAILGQEIRQLQFDLLSHKLSKEQEQQRIDQTAQAIANQRENQERLEAEAAGLTAHGDYVLNKAKAANEMRRFIDGRSLWTYTRDALSDQFPGCKLVEKSDQPLTIDISLSLTAKQELKTFLDNRRGLGTTSLASPASGATTCVFDNHVSFGKHGYEVVNHSHPLIRFLAEKMANEQHHPVVSTQIDSSDLELASGDYFFVARRWSTTGAKTEERLVTRAINIQTGMPIHPDDAEKLINHATHKATDWPGVVSSISSSDLEIAFNDLEDQLDREFDQYQAEMAIENSDRIEFLLNTLRQKTDRDIAVQQGVIDRYRASGNLKMVPAAEGRIRKHRERFEIKEAELNTRRTISSEPRDVISGVIRVQ